MTRPRQGHKLTRRESLIYGLIRAGRTNQQIEDELKISRSTRKSHVNRIYKKLGERLDRKIPQDKIMSDEEAADNYVESHCVGGSEAAAFLAGCAKVRAELGLKIDGENK